MKVTETTVLRTSDVHGSGFFGASRGSRKHIGVDIVAAEGTKVYSPFSGVISKYGYAYASDLRWRYIEITGADYRARIFYTELDPAHYVGKEVGENWFLGLAQGIENKYAGITPHIHFELHPANSTDQLTPIDPTEFLKKKVS